MLTSTLDKESVARLLNVLFTSPVPFVKGKLILSTEGGETDNLLSRFFTLNKKPGKEPSRLDVYILDKNISDNAKSSVYAAITRYKVVVQASIDDKHWIVHACHLEKLPRSEKRILKAKQAENLEESKPFEFEEAITAKVRKADDIGPHRASSNDVAFFSTKKHPGRNIKMLVSNQKYQDKWRIENLIEWSVQICRDLQENFHSKGLLHRDIKPTNVVVDPRDFKRANLIDLELAKEENTRAYSLVGSHGYIATELYLAEHEKRVNDSLEPFPYSKKTDIFALAYTLAALFGSTSIDDAMDKAHSEGLDHIDFINSMAEIALLEKPDKRFKNLFVIQGVDIFRGYPNPAHEQKIKDCLTDIFMKMSQPRAKKRPSIENVIAALNKVKVLIERDFAKATKTASVKEPEPETSGPHL